MNLADWIVLGIVAVFIIIGVLVGFGKGLKFFTSGIFGIIIAVVVCYLTLGLVLDIPAVQELLDSLESSIGNSGSFGTLLVDIGIGKIIVAVVLFIVVQIVRIIIVKIIKGFVEIDNILFKVINKILGAAFFFVVAVALMLIAFQVISLIGGTTYSNVLTELQGSIFNLDDLLINNPLNSIFN